MIVRQAAVLVFGLAMAWSPAEAKKVEAAPVAAPAAARPSPAATFKAALAPYLSHAADEPGWVLGGEPEVVDIGNDTLAIRVPNLAYRHPVAENGPVTVELGTVAGKATRSGANWRLAIEPVAAVTVRDGAGMLAEFSLGEGRLDGVWNPVREAFERFDFGITDIRARLRNGDVINIGHAGLRGQTMGGAVTERAEIASSIGRLVAETGQGRPLGTVEAASLNLRAEALDAPIARAHVQWTHVRPVEKSSAIAAELTPALFELSGLLAPFPWVESLRNLPTVLAGLATAPDEKRKPMAEDLWNRVRPVLHTADARIRNMVISARSANLIANGRGEAAFPTNGAQAGKLSVDVRGINERINGLTRDERTREPLLFPALALMTALGERVSENGRRHHRYELELVGNSLRLNGQDISTIQPPK